jgi:hypothetical protein
MGNELKNKILIQNGIISDLDQKKPLILNCPRCELTNVIENKYCSKCSYPLKPEAYDEIKEFEKSRIKSLEEKHAQDMKSLRSEMHNQFNEIMFILRENPALIKIKPDILEKKTKT